MNHETATDDGFAELEVIEAANLKLSGSYHAYTYYAQEDMEGAADEVAAD